MRVTEQRRIILENLKFRKDHPTADDIYLDVRQTLPRISLGTVYRNLEMMSRSGVIQTLEVGGGVKRFDADISSHEHFACHDCGKIEDLPFRMVLPGLDEEWVRNRDIKGFHLLYYGTCPECRKKNKK